PLTVLAAVAAALAIAGTAAFAGGLFSGDDGSTDALPVTPTSAPPPGRTHAQPQPTASAHRPSPTPSPSRATPSASRTKTRSPSPTPSLSTARATGTVRDPSPTPTRSAPASSAPAAPVLRRGDSGPEVVELQKRLQQAWVYQGPASGRYDDEVESAVRQFQSWTNIQDDPSGVYGPHTRRALEASTQEP
ncbi:peptidoglycan-binding domain-containing protein, partial [Streptomyces beijiangensis]